MKSFIIYLLAIIQIMFAIPFLILGFIYSLCLDGWNSGKYRHKELDSYINKFMNK